MIGLPLVAALAAIALPAAGPAPVGELPFLSLGADRVATCLAATGGGWVALTDTSPFQVRQLRLLRATPAGDLVPEVAGIDGDRFPGRDGRLHRAVAGVAAAPAAPAPRLRVSVRSRRIHRDDPAVLRVHCSSACDLRAVAPPPRAAIATGQRHRPGTVTLRLVAVDEAPLARRDGRPLPVTIRATAPGGVDVAERRVAIPLRRLPRR